MWKTIKSHEAYEISEYGDVRNKHGRLLKGQVSKLGYKYLFLAGKWHLAHRLVSKNYLPDILDKQEVNHIDGNKLNNHYSNLEWVTHSENIQKSFDSGQRKKIFGEDHWKFGVLHTKKTKEKMSAKKIGVNHPKFKGWYKFGDSLFTSMNEAAVSTGLDRRKIKKLVRDSIDGWLFIPK